MNLATLFSSRLSQALVGALMASAWIFFAIVHVRVFNSTGESSYLVFCVTETVAALLFLVRSKPISVSADPRDWAIAFAGTFAPLWFIPTGNALLTQASILIFAGAVFQLIGMISLNRSIGMVPALRVVKTRGMYRLIRHPLYASYFVMYSGYLLANTSMRNMLIFVLSMALLAVRIKREESLLALDSGYRAYMARVKYRVLPFVF